MTSAKERLARDRNFVAPTSEKHPDRRDRRVAWEWNIPLLVKTGITAASLFLALGVAYTVQSLKIAQGVLERIAEAEKTGAANDQIKWLMRYVALVPSDKEHLVQLAIVVDNQVANFSDIDEARKRLSGALAVCDQKPGYENQTRELRKRLIPRLLQSGPFWASEVEKQIYRLNAPEGDPAATKWLAQSLVAQRAGSQYSDRDPSKFKKSDDYWGWLANRPTAEVYYLATQLNPTDVDLLATFVSICRQSPNWMFAPGAPVDQDLVKKHETAAIEVLQGIRDDGHAQYVVYKMLANPDQALNFAKQSWQAALQRLEENLPSSDSTSSNAIDSDAAKLESLSGSRPIASGFEAYQPYWDWQLTLESALSLGKTAPQQTRQIFDQLLKLDRPKIARAQRESTYLEYGRWLFDQGDSTKAKEILRIGSKSVSESLDLYGLLAYVYTAEKNADEARTAIDEFKRLVELQETRLAGPLGARLTSDIKLSISERLAIGAWDILLLDGLLAAESNNLNLATKLLEKAFQSPLFVEPAKRVRAGRLLADCYGRLQLVDMRRSVLDKCIILTPNDTSLRRVAAEAWRAVGASDRALQLLSSLNDDGTFETALEMAQSRAYAEASKPKELVDIIAVRDALQEARARFEKLDAQGQRSAPGWRLELLELNYSDFENATVDANNKLDQLQSIAESYAGIAEVQMFAASNFASGGRLAAAEAAIARLEQIAQNSQAKSDIVNVQVAKSGILALTNRTDEAVDSLKAAAEKLPENRLVLITTATNILIRTERLLDAYKLLRSVPEQELDTQSLMTLAGLANRLPADKSPGLDLDKDLANWTARLKEIEGSNGTHWQYLAAEKLLIDSRTAANPQSLLEEASRLVSEIDAKRPRWGRAAGLGARIAEQKGLSEEAVTLYRQAIREGDRTVSTNLGLVRVLLSLNRIDQAEQELERIKSTTSSEIPTFALADVLQRKGDFKKAISLASDLTKQKPEDEKSWLLLARSLLTASRAASTATQEAENMQAEAQSALDRATAITQGKSPQTWAERFRYQLTVAGREAALEEIQLIEASALTNISRLILAAQCYFELREYSQVRQRLDAVLQTDANNTVAHLLYYELHNRLGDLVSSLNSLRLAQQSAPENQEIRERLALNLAFSADVAGTANSDGRDQLWGERQSEIDQLLQVGAAKETQRSLLIQAMINLKKGDATRQANAIQVLKQLATSAQHGAESKRLMAAYYTGLWEAYKDSGGHGLDEVQRAEHDRASNAAKDNFSQALALYDDLLRVASPNPVDAVYLTAVYLVASQREKEAGRPELAEQRLRDAELALQKLEKITGSSLASLQLRLRIATAGGMQKDANAITQQWVKGVNNLEDFGEERLWELAGRTLGELGFAEESLVWLEKAYLADQTKYKGFVIALAKNNQIVRAEEICVKEFSREPSADAAILLCQVVLNSASPQDLSVQAEDVIKSAMAKFQDSPALLESIGTLRLIQGKNELAAQIFERSQASSAESVRLLNNMAMALSNIPGRQSEALAKIQRALALVKSGDPVPELLDTLAIVQTRMGNFSEARMNFEKAIQQRPDPRFQIHLADVLFQVKDGDALKTLWLEINQLNLANLTLTKEERETVERMQLQFKESL